MGNEGAETIKGRLFNLVFYTDEEQRFRYFQQLFSHIIDKFPCRIVFIQKSNLEIQPEKMVQKIDLSQTAQKTGDQFLIQTTSEQLSQVPFVLLPLLVPDLPIYLIWGQDPISDQKILPQLLRYSTRLVYDTQGCANLQSFCREMMKKNKELTNYMDIDWALISGWRDVIAQIFSVPGRLPILQDCHSVGIYYNHLATPSIKRLAIQAIYFQGWLAAQLKWHFQSIEKTENGTWKIHYHSHWGEVVVTLHPKESPYLPPSSLSGIEFLTVNHCALSISLHEQQSKASVNLSTPEKCELPFSLPIPNLQRGLALMKEVFYHPSGVQYLNMLKLISEMSWDA
jgi:glucose-6-phosphate dehydrogenase assembly protein OpcA